MAEVDKALLELFNSNKRAEFLVDIANQRCVLNIAADKYYQLDADLITDFFPNLIEIQHHHESNYLDCNGNTKYLSITPLLETNHALVSVSQESSWTKFSEYNQQLHKIHRKLSSLDDQSLIFKGIVDMAKKYLAIDRIGILVISEDRQTLHGTWGTSVDGKTVDEYYYSEPMEPLKGETWVQEALQRKDFVAVQYSNSLRQDDQIIGKGWNTMSAFWDGDMAVGWVACDNFINNEPLSDWKKEIIAGISKVLGQLINDLKKRELLKSSNELLAEKVDERTQSLQRTVDNLHEAQQELVESEKLASLGAMVAGISHEVNTPLGISLTAISHGQSMTQDMVKTFEAKQITKNQLSEYFGTLTESFDISQKNIKRAVELIKSFKQVSVNQSNDIKQQFNLAMLVDDLIISFRHRYKNKDLSFKNNISLDLQLNSYPGSWSQVFSNLINNALLHAFNEMTEAGVVEFSSKLKGDYVVVYCTDNGSGANDEVLSQMLEPFYTTKRGAGGSGLGLNIIRNIIEKLGGQLVVRSNKPKGLVFEMTLPIAITE